ncbi:MAG TPA: putative metal-dependent hydrolase [Acidobacteriaceae bacterium]
MSTTAATPAAVDPRYPVGKFRRADADLVHHEAAIAAIAALPENLRSAVADLTQEQLDTPYREGGWAVRQLVHHLADSHANAVVRVRLALTEDWPTIKPYNEKLWAELPDAQKGAVDPSLELLDGLHARWTLLLASLAEEQWQRGYTHPDNGRQSIAEATALYAWHCRHHLAHITELRKRNGW